MSPLFWKLIFRDGTRSEGDINIVVYGYSHRIGEEFIPGFASGWMKVAIPKWCEFKRESKPGNKSAAVTPPISGTVYLDDAYLFLYH